MRVRADLLQQEATMSGGEQADLLQDFSFSPDGGGLDGDVGDDIAECLEAAREVGAQPVAERQTEEPAGECGGQEGSGRQRKVGGEHD